LQRYLVHLLCGIDQHGDPRGSRDKVLQQLKVLSDDALGHDCGEPGDIPTRMRQALDQTKRDRVGYIEENHRKRRSGRMDRDCGIARRSDDNLWSKRDQLSQQCRELIITTTKVPILDSEIPPDHITALA